MEHDGERAPLPDAVRRSDIPVDVFNPLLRSLLSWNLVGRVEADDGSHRWELSGSAQRQLDALTPPLRRSSASLAYLDHWCANCRQQRLTHLIDGRYLCESCEHAQSSRAATPEDHSHALHDLGSRSRRHGRP